MSVTSAKSSCDIFFTSARIQKAKVDFSVIDNFFGFKSSTSRFDLRFVQGREVQYWTAESGKILESPRFISEYQGNLAELTLSRDNNVDWTFRWAVLNSKTILFPLFTKSFSSFAAKKISGNDFVTTDGNKLILNKSTVRTNPKSETSLVTNQTLTFVKKDDGTIEVTSVVTNDSIKGNRIIIGDETTNTFILTPKL